MRPRADQGGEQQQHGPRRHQDDQRGLPHVLHPQGKLFIFFYQNNAKVCTG